MPSVKIPVLGVVRAATVEQLSRKVRRKIIAENLGASNVGSDWPILEGGEEIARLRYNGFVERIADND